METENRGPFGPDAFDNYSVPRAKMTTRTLTTEVTIGQIKAALLFAAKEDVRGYLKGVCIDHTPNGTLLIATDGNRAIVVCLDTEPFAGEPTRYVVGRDILETVAKLNSKAGSVAFVWEQDTNPDPTREGVTVVSVPRVTVAAIPTVDLQVTLGKFPDYTRIIPEKASGQKAQYNAYFLADCAKARKALGIRNEGCIEIAHNGKGPGMVRLTDDALAIVMPFSLGHKVDEVELTAPSWFTGKVAAAEAA